MIHTPERLNLVWVKRNVHNTNNRGSFLLHSETEIKSAPRGNTHHCSSKVLSSALLCATFNSWINFPKLSGLLSVFLSPVSGFMNRTLFLWTALRTWSGRQPGRNIKSLSLTVNRVDLLNMPTWLFSLFLNCLTSLDADVISKHWYRWNDWFK